MNPERNQSLEEIRRIVIVLAIVREHGKNPNLSLKHPFCQENPAIREEVEAILGPLNGENKNSQDTCDKI